jgi:hypothetical protein
MITFQEFKAQIDLKHQFDKKLEELEKVLNSRDLFEIDLVQISYEFFDNYIRSHFDDDGIDLIFWWLYESVPKVIYTDETEYNVEDLQDLWKYLVEYKHLK